MNIPAPEKKKNRFVLFVMAGLAIWLICLLSLASWYQNNYIQNFTDSTPDFLNSEFTDRWFKTLLKKLPEKSTQRRIIQLWKPDCLCNRFAQRHALNGIESAKQSETEHITLIPNASESDIQALQALNPDTKVLTLKTNQLATWPTSPSVFIEGPLSQLLYFGPLGFGAFCSQPSTGVIGQILESGSPTKAKPFYNIIGKGCFCNWQD